LTLLWDSVADFEIQISESGLKLDAFDGFEDAAKKAIGLAHGTEKM
jgi:hypothetical protein